MKYAESIYQTKRWKTREVKVGEVGVGGDNPIRLQSMTNSNTRDVEATVDQIIRLADHGCEIARVTVQGKKRRKPVRGLKIHSLKKGTRFLLLQISIFIPLQRCLLLNLWIK